MLTESETATIRGRLTRAATSPKLSTAQRAQLVKDFLADAGLTRSALARRYGVSPQTVLYHLRRAVR
jgi:DNA-binding CsgD family transcriptional regulator